MALSRKYYKEFAAILAKNRTMYRKMNLDMWETDIAGGFKAGAEHALIKIKVDLERLFEQDNPLFDRDLFTRAARPQQEEK